MSPDLGPIATILPVGEVRREAYGQGSSGLRKSVPTSGGTLEPSGVGPLSTFAQRLPPYPVAGSRDPAEATQKAYSTVFRDLTLSSHSNPRTTRATHSASCGLFGVVFTSTPTARPSQTATFTVKCCEAAGLHGS